MGYLGMKKTLENIENGDLYALLSICDNHELEPLVEIITETITNSLDTCDLYKKNKSNHKKYYELIGDEIRLFGSDSFVSMYRGGEGVTYDEVVFDVCERLSIPSKKNATISNEQNLLDLYNLEKDKLTLNSTKNVTHSIKFIAQALITRLHPVGLAFLPFQLSSPAFRVSVPCVILIADLRQKKLKELRNTSKDILVASANSKKVLTKKNKSLNIHNSKNQKVLSLAEVSDLSSTVQWNCLEKKNEEISRLSQLFHAVPNAVTAENVRKTKYMEVVINGSLIQAKDGNGFRAIARGADSKFTEHARLFSPSKLSKIVNASALFQVASTVVAQQHLADISAKLEDIKEGINNIENFQLNERESEVVAAIEYFEQVAPIIIGGDFSKSVLNQIEAQEPILLKIQTHLMTDIKNLNLEKEMKDKDTFGTESMVTEIGKYQDKINSHYKQLLLCIRARACGWQLLSIYPGEEALATERKKHIIKVLEGLREGSLINASEKSINYNIKRMASKFNTDNTLNKRKLELLNQKSIFVSGVKVETKRVHKELLSIEKLAKNYNNSEATILMKIEGNKIIATA